MVGNIVFRGALAISIGALVVSCSGSSNSGSKDSGPNDSMFISCGDDSKVASNGSDLMKSGGAAIVNGQPLQMESEIGRHVVMILGEMNGESYLCTGSVLESGLVLTAAHCAASSPSKMKVMFSERALCGATLGEIKKTVSKSVVTVKAVRINPEYLKGLDESKRADQALKNPSLSESERDKLRVRANEVKVMSAGFDFALLKVGQADLPASALTSTVPSEPLDDLDMTSGRLIMVGFGNIDSKSTGGGRLRVTSLSPENIIIGRGSKDIPIWGIRQPDTGVCHGDSGGPLFFLKNQKLTLIGVTSEVGGKTGDECSGVSVFGKPWSQTEWLTKSIEELSY